MALVLGINSYATVDEADLYFESRIDVAAWENADDDMKEQALVTATSYLDELSYLGYATDATQPLSWPRKGNFADEARGRTVTFDDDYTWTELDVSSDVLFITALSQLSFDIQMLKKATFEQAYHLINNSGLFDSTGGAPDSIRIGTIQLTGLSGQEAPKMSSTAMQLVDPLRPIKQNRKVLSF